MDITVYKAQYFGPDNLVPDLRIVATETFPDLDFDLTASAFNEAHKKRFKEQADLILDGLRLTLPQGTLDALLVALLDYKRSIFVVRGPIG